MLTCEKCAASFPEPTGPVEVTSTRVLCPACAAARAKEKALLAAKKKALDGRSTINAAPPPAASRNAHAPAPAPKPVVAKPSTPAAAKPAAERPALAKPVPATELRTPERRGIAKPAPAPEARATVNRIKPAGERAPSNATPARSATPTSGIRRELGAKKKPKPEIELHSKDLKKSANRPIIIGYFVSLVLALVAGGFVWTVVGKKKSEKAAEDAHTQEVKDFYAAFMGMDINSEESAKQAVAFGEERRALWEPESIGSEVVSRLARAKSNIDTFGKRRNLVQRLETIEKNLANTAQLSSEAVAEERRNLEDIESQANVVSSEFLARVSALRASTDEIFASRLLEEARAAAQASPDRSALTRYQRAEDESLVLLEKAKKDQRTDDAKRLEEQYRTVITESDELVAKVFTPEEIERVPWRDLMVPDAGWQAPPAKGFDWRIENGTMHVIGPGPDAEGQPVLSIGDDEKWRDFQLEFEFTLLKGNVDLYFRLGLGRNAMEIADARRELTNESESPLMIGQSYTVFASYVGSAGEFTIKSDDFSPDLWAVPWTKTRKGAFAIVPHEGSEIKFTSMRARVLRASE